VIPLPVDAVRIGQCVSHHAAREPEREAAVHDQMRLTYGQLDDAMARWAKALLAAGVGKGDRVAMLCPPSVEWLTVMLATTEIGAIWTGYHPRYQLPEFRHVTELAEPIVLVAFRYIHGRDCEKELLALMAEVPSIRTLVTIDAPLEGGTMADAFLRAGDDVTDNRLEAARASVTIDDTAVLIFTSGTTGQPKAAMVKHRALLTGSAVELEHWPMDRPRILHMMPTNHIAGVGMTGVFGIYAGGTLVFQDRFDPGGLLRLLEEEQIDHLLGSPVQFHMMANHPDLTRRDLSNLKFMTWGGAPMAADVVATLNDLPCALRTSFGMTELGLYITFTAADADFEVLSRTIGKPHAGFDIRVADAEGNVAAPGEQGEIQARGDWLLAGYFRDDDATRKAYTADGWFRTGDVVEVWADGNLEIVGRTKEMFISGGFNIYPREVEIAIEEHPDTGLVAVLGVPDKVFSEVGYAFVEARSGTALNEAGLDAWCRERLANYKVPKTFDIRAELPRLPIGKIDKQTLKRELETRGNREST